MQSVQSQKVDSLQSEKKEKIISYGLEIRKV